MRIWDRRTRPRWTRLEQDRARWALGIASVCGQAASVERTVHSKIWFAAANRAVKGG